MINYYFYWHLNDKFPANKVIDAIKNHDYGTFYKLQQQWGEFYMPNHYFNGDDIVEINKDNFNLIDYSEYECG